MSKKSFFLGVVTGVVLTFVVLIVIGLVIQKSDANFPAQYLEKPVSYENKKETSFKVFQVLGNAALATEISTEGLIPLFIGKTVVLLGKDYYNNQVITVKKQAVKTFHPGRKQRNLFHLFFCDIAGTDGAAWISDRYIKKASVISDIKNRHISWYIFLSDNSQLHTGYPQDKTK